MRVRVETSGISPAESFDDIGSVRILPNGSLVVILSALSEVVYASGYWTTYQVVEKDE